MTDLDLRLFLVDEYSLECLRASMAVFKLFTKAQFWMALFGKCLNWLRMICPWTTMNLSTLASCIMTAVISTAGQLTTQLQHLGSYWCRGNDDTPFLQDVHTSAVFQTLTLVVQQRADSFGTCPSRLS